jgi:hypothetical protein
LTEEYRAALAVGYFKIAQACYWFDGRASFVAYEKTINNTIDKILDLRPHFSAAGETRVFQLVQWLLGFRFAMHFLFRVRSAIHLVKSKLKNTVLLRYVLSIRRGKLFQREAKRHSSSA